MNKNEIFEIFLFPAYNVYFTATLCWMTSNRTVQGKNEQYKCLDFRKWKNIHIFI